MVLKIVLLYILPKESKFNIDEKIDFEFAKFLIESKKKMNEIYFNNNLQDVLIIKLKFKIRYKKYQFRFVKGPTRITKKTLSGYLKKC